MRTRRFCLTLTALALFLCCATALLAQDDSNPAAAAPAGEESAIEEFREIDRPGWVGNESAPSPATEQDAPGAETKDANYWFNRGVLLSVYGNEKAAIGAFQQAAKLAPGWSSPYFQMGIAFGEDGQYAEALNVINKAIELDASKGAYYYGRARVHLLSGDALQARADFQKAAELGDQDAIRYLNKQMP